MPNVNPTDKIEFGINSKTAWLGNWWTVSYLAVIDWLCSRSISILPCWTGMCCWIPRTTETQVCQILIRLFCLVDVKTVKQRQRNTKILCWMFVDFKPPWVKWKPATCTLFSYYSRQTECETKSRAYFIQSRDPTCSIKRQTSLLHSLTGLSVNLPTLIFTLDTLSSSIFI